MVLTLYAAVIGVSGSALVFREQIERAMHPAEFRVRRGVPQSLDAIVAQAERTHPGWRVSSLKDFTPGEPLTLLMRPAQGALGLNYRSVSVDRSTGAVLSDQMRFAGVFGFLTSLHFYLLAGHTGLLVSGWMALGLVLLCVTGLVVWWPGVQRCLSALVLRPRRRWQRLLWDLHAVTGFWFAVPLAIQQKVWPTGRVPLAACSARLGFPMTGRRSMRGRR